MLPGSRRLLELSGWSNYSVPKMELSMLPYRQLMIKSFWSIPSLMLTNFLFRLEKTQKPCRLVRKRMFLCHIVFQVRRLSAKLNKLTELKNVHWHWTGIVNFQHNWVTLLLHEQLLIDNISGNGLCIICEHFTFQLQDCFRHLVTHSWSSTGATITLIIILNSKKDISG